MQKTKVELTQDELPRKWYNIQADLKKPLPPVLDRKSVV